MMTAVMELGPPSSRRAAIPSRDGAVVRAESGDVEAVVELYEKHHARVRSFARRLVGENSIAEDLVHDVFLALPTLISRFRGESSFESYLISIAANRAKEYIRSAARKRAMVAKFANEPPAREERPDETYERRELANALSVALDQLPVDQRIAFVLCEVEERTSVEVAAMIGESDGTVRARVFHAKKKLRDYLEKYRAPSSSREGKSAEVSQ